MITALFNVLDLHSNQECLIIENKNYPLDRKTNKNKQPYYMIYLPNTTGSIGSRSGEQGKSEHHITIFKHQKPQEKFFSAYHYTGVYPCENKNFSHILVRVYFNRHDQLSQINIWVYDNLSKKTGAQLEVNDFFDKQQKEDLLNIILAVMSPIISNLRSIQNNFLAPKQQQYDLLNQEMITLSQTFHSNDSTETKKNYLKKANDTIALLSAISLFSNDSDKILALKAIYLSHANHIQDEINTTESNQKITVLESSEPDLGFAGISKASQESDIQSRIQEAQAIILRMQASETEANDEQKLAEQLDVIMQKRKSKQFKKLSNKELKIWGQINISAHYFLKEHCIQLLGYTGESSDAWRFFAYLSDVPNHLLQTIIERDDADALKSLFDAGFLSLYSVLDDGMTMYEKAFQTDKTRCITYFFELGVTPTMMSFSTLSSAFDGDTINPYLFLKGYEQWDNLNKLISEQLINNLSITDLIENSSRAVYNSRRFCDIQKLKYNQNTTDRNDSALLAIELYEALTESTKLLMDSPGYIDFFKNKKDQPPSMVATLLSYIIRTGDKEATISLNTIKPFLAPAVDAVQTMNKKLSVMKPSQKKSVIEAFIRHSQTGSDITIFFQSLNLGQDYHRLTTRFKEALNNIEVDSLMNYFFHAIERMLFPTIPSSSSSRQSQNQMSFFSPFLEIKANKHENHDEQTGCTIF